MELKIAKTHKDARLPSYETEGAACFDLYTVAVRGVSMAEEKVLRKYGKDDRCEMLIEPGTSAQFHTGLRFEIPQGWAMLIYSRSGHGFSSGVRLANCVGVIDSDYRGEVMVKLTADPSGRGITVYNRDRIAQAMLVPVERAQFIEVDDLSDTVRGAGGFGSTGA